jgi:hypothetical protein
MYSDLLATCKRAAWRFDVALEAVRNDHVDCIVDSKISLASLKRSGKRYG